jgi:hypothetical protein
MSSPNAVAHAIVPAQCHKGLPLTEKFNLAELAAAGIQVSLLLLPILECFLDVVVTLDANVCVLAVEVLELHLTGTERDRCRAL